MIGQLNHPAALRERVRVLELDFNQLDREAALEWLWAWPSTGRFGYVTTPNVDHVVRLMTEHQSPEVHEAYAASDLTLCDSKVLALVARWYGIRLVVATGSDLTADLLLRLAHGQDRVVIIGGTPDTMPALQRRFGLADMRQHIPPMGLMHNEPALTAAAQFIVDNPARFVFITVGSPQQEIIALRARKLGAQGGLALCVGASLDFLTGRSRRAPWIFRVLTLEWLYRLLHEPRRLWRRYLLRSPRIFWLMYRDARQRRRAARP
jgi:exopolysaccharide biosynthesis WecB/TagA/CpsF family protein